MSRVGTIREDQCRAELVWAVDLLGCVLMSPELAGQGLASRFVAVWSDSSRGGLESRGALTRTGWGG
jgi:hypothetical protein